MSGRDHTATSAPIARLCAAALLGTALAGPVLIGPVLAVEERQPPGPSAAQAVDAPGEALKNSDDVSTLLPLLLTSTDRRRLAAELKETLREGKVEAAEARLNGAIEMGTLAIVLIDRLREPGLLAALQTLDLRGDDGKPLVPQGAVDGGARPGPCDLVAGVETPGLAEMKEALEQEQTRNRAISDELAALTQNYRTLAESRESDTTFATSTISALQESLKQAEERGHGSALQLSSLQEEHRTLQEVHTRKVAATESRVAELEARLTEEREQGRDAMRRLAVAEEEVQALRSHKDRDTSVAQSDIAQIQAALSQEKARLAQETARADAIARELALASEELRAAREIREPGPAPVMARLDAKGVRIPLAAPQEERPSLAPQLLLAAGAAEPPRRSEGAPQVVASAAPVVLAPVEAAPPPDKAEHAPIASLPIAQTSPEPVLAETGKAAAPPDAAGSDDRLIARADALLSKGDVSGARLLLERSVEHGNARAAFLLAETFDPNVLSRLGAIGIRGDAGKARELYAKARAMGIAQAGERIEALSR